jgi:hypothetical protein
MFTGVADEPFIATRCRQDGNHLASFGSNCVRKSYNDIDITLDIVIITKNTNILELSYQMLRKQPLDRVGTRSAQNVAEPEGPTPKAARIRKSD